ncbi:MAG: hypothetical protein RSG79_19685 [Pseudomonas sp.]
MPKSSQEIRRYLQGLTSDLKWLAVELARIADRLSQAGNEADAQAVLRMCRTFQDGEERLVGYAEEAHLGLIVRAKSPFSVPV